MRQTAPTLANYGIILLLLIIIQHSTGKKNPVWDYDKIENTKIKQLIRELEEFFCVMELSLC